MLAVVECGSSVVVEHVARARAALNQRGRAGSRAGTIDYAYGAIEEAEYAVLAATLARMDADELAAGAKT